MKIRLLLADFLKEAATVLPATTILSVVMTIALLLQGCDKEREHPVPYVRVSVSFNVLHYNLSAPGLSAQFSRQDLGGNAGYQGIIVYRLSPDEFRAYDRACPSAPHNCIVSIDEDNAVLAFSPASESRFILTDGSVVEGPARFPLRQYQTTFDPNTNRLRITN
ncbi:MAG: hypothetical protein ACLFN2_05295 [Bacteroidales bacterium]